MIWAGQEISWWAWMPTWPWTSEPGGRARGMKVAFSCVEQERGGRGQVELYRSTADEWSFLFTFVFYINLGVQCSSELENSYSYRSRNAAVYYNNKYYSHDNYGEKILPTFRATWLNNILWSQLFLYGIVIWLVCYVVTILWGARSPVYISHINRYAQYYTHSWNLQQVIANLPKWPQNELFAIFNFSFGRTWCHAPP